MVILASRPVGGYLRKHVILLFELCEQQAASCKSIPCPMTEVTLVSPDALEVIVVTDSLTDLLSVSTDLTDVTLVSDDTY